MRTEGALESALEKAWAHERSFSIINVQLEKDDGSDALTRLGKRLVTAAKPK